MYCNSVTWKIITATLWTSKQTWFLEICVPIKVFDIFSQKSISFYVYSVRSFYPYFQARFLWIVQDIQKIDWIHWSWRSIIYRKCQASHETGIVWQMEGNKYYAKHSILFWFHYLQSLIIFAKNSILDVWQGSEKAYSFPCQKHHLQM